MNITPLVSILVPVYNVENFIEECAISIINQTYLNLEIIFMDDKSTDSSLSVLKNVVNKYGKARNITILSADINEGSSSIRNKLINRSKGEYIAFVDSDDLIPSDSIYNLVQTAVKFNADIVKGNFTQIRPDGNILKDYSFPEEWRKYVNSMINWCEISPSMCGGIYRKSLFTDNSIYFIKGNNFGEDFCVSARLAYYSKVVKHLSICTYNYRLNQNSVSHSKNVKNLMDLINMSNIVRQFYMQKPDYNLFYDSIIKGRIKVLCYILSSSSKQMHAEIKREFRDVLECTNISLTDRLKVHFASNNKVIYRLLRKFF